MHQYLLKNEVVTWKIRITLALLDLDVFPARLSHGVINRIGLRVIVKGLSSIWDMSPCVIIVTINVDDRLGIDGISMRGDDNLDVALL